MQEEYNRNLTIPWTPRDVWFAVGVFILWIGAAIGFGFLADYLSWQVDMGVFISVWELALLVPAWWFTVRKYNVNWSMLGIRKFSGSALGIGCGLMILSFSFNLAYNLFLSLFNLQAQPDLVGLFDQVASPWPLIVGGVLIAPVVEEIFFRGFVFTGFRQRYGWQRAALISAGLFSAVHLQPLALLPIMILGLIFAYLYQRTESIWPAVIMHVLTNALSLGAAYLISRLNLPVL